jgi:hypothetical protein
LESPLAIGQAGGEKKQDENDTGSAGPDISGGGGVSGQDAARKLAAPAAQPTRAPIPVWFLLLANDFDEKERRRKKQLQICLKVAAEEAAVRMKIALQNQRKEPETSNTKTNPLPAPMDGP